MGLDRVVWLGPAPWLNVRIGSIPAIPDNLEIKLASCAKFARIALDFGPIQSINAGVARLILKPTGDT